MQFSNTHKDTKIPPCATVNQRNQLLEENGDDPSNKQTVKPGKNWAQNDSIRQSIPQKRTSQLYLPLINKNSNGLRSGENWLDTFQKRIDPGNEKREAIVNSRPICHDLITCQNFKIKKKAAHGALLTLAHSNSSHGSIFDCFSSPVRFHVRKQNCVLLSRRTIRSTNPETKSRTPSNSSSSKALG